MATWWYTPVYQQIVTSSFVSNMITTKTNFYNTFKLLENHSQTCIKSSPWEKEKVAS